MEGTIATANADYSSQAKLSRGGEPPRLFHRAKFAERAQFVECMDADIRKILNDVIWQSPRADASLLEAGNPDLSWLNFRLRDSRTQSSDISTTA
jgi:hypothetical protein